MENPLDSFYCLPDISKYEDVHLQTLSENCAVLEEKLLIIAENMPKRNRNIVEAYIQARNDLEVETVKAALRWGKRHYK